MFKDTDMLQGVGAERDDRKIFWPGPGIAGSVSTAEDKGDVGWRDLGSVHYRGVDSTHS